MILFLTCVLIGGLNEWGMSGGSCSKNKLEIYKHFSEESVGV